MAPPNPGARPHAAASRMEPQGGLVVQPQGCSGREEATVWMPEPAQLGPQALGPGRPDLPRVQVPGQLPPPWGPREGRPNPSQGQKQTNTKDGALATCSGGESSTRPRACQGHFPGTCALALPGPGERVRGRPGHKAELQPLLPRLPPRSTRGRGDWEARTDVATAGSARLRVRGPHPHGTADTQEKCKGGSDIHGICTQQG